jgi:hypothetical protein
MANQTARVAITAVKKFPDLPELSPVRARQAAVPESNCGDRNSTIAGRGTSIAPRRPLTAVMFTGLEAATNRLVALGV